MRLIDADEFDRRLAAAEFNAALNNADDESRPFESQTMYYSTQSFREVMKRRPTIDAVPIIRCKDCRYGKSAKNGDGDDIIICKNPDSPASEEMVIMPDWFCADGMPKIERRNKE